MQYRTLNDMIPVAQQIVQEVGQIEQIDKILSNFLEALLQQYGHTNKAINYYNALQNLFDNITDKTQYESVLAQHSRVLRAFCHNLRVNIVMNEDEIARIIREHFQLTSDSAVKLIGIRKSIRITANMGLITPWLAEDEPEAAAVSMCSWAATSPNMIIDNGFLVAYGNKFDTLNKGCLTKMNVEAVNDPSSLTPGEFALICRHLLDFLLELHGQDKALVFLEYVFKNALHSYAKKTADNDFRLLRDYGEKFCGINIKATNRDQWVTCALSTKSGIFTSDKIPAKALITYGMELLFPIAPILSKEWMNAVDSNIIPFKCKLGWVDNVMLYHAHYECSRGVKVRLLPTVTCTFVAGNDAGNSAKIMASSQSGLLGSGYTWKACDTSNNNIVQFTTDDLLAKQIFVRGKTYVISPDFINVSEFPDTAMPYVLNPRGSESKMPNIKVNDLVMIAASSQPIPVWGRALTELEAEQILPWLEFLPGQEKEVANDNRLYCRVTDQPINTVAKAVMSKNNYECVLVHIAAL